jgi:hypothetical protein
MWGRKPTSTEGETSDDQQPQRLRDALRQARIESAERSAVVVDLRDAEAARLETLNDALDDLFAEMPSDVELFDRGIARGDPIRLWIDVISYVVMGRDKRTYRFLQDSRNGRIVLAESPEVEDIVEAVTKYAARRIIERERALASDEHALGYARVAGSRWRRRWQASRIFVLGLVVGFAAFFAAVWLMATRV